MKKSITGGIPSAMLDYVDPNMISIIRGAEPDVAEKLFGPRAKIKLNRREKLMIRARGVSNGMREKIALKIAPWLSGE